MSRCWPHGCPAGAARPQRLRGSVPLHGGFRRLPSHAENQPAAFDAYPGGDPAARRVCAGCVLSDGRGRLRDRAAPGPPFAVIPHAGERGPAAPGAYPRSTPSSWRPMCSPRARPGRRCPTRRPGAGSSGACGTGRARLGLANGRSHALLGTVPPQHMYGFESSVLLALQSGSALCAERPFYPADVCSALAATAAAARADLDTGSPARAPRSRSRSLPATDLIVSATAPLSQDLAREVEQRFRTPLLEIYGSTETGQIATRRTARDRGVAAVAGRMPHARRRGRPGRKAATSSSRRRCAMCWS